MAKTVGDTDLGANTDQELDSKVAVVTGAGKGIGRGIALALARHGADVVITELDESAGNQVSTEVSGLGRRSRTFRHDVTSWDETRRVIDTVIDEFGAVDILVNNAGVSRGIPFVDIDEAEWDRVNETNVKGTFFACRAVVPHMIERRQGKIISVSSMAGKEGQPLFTHYCASKFAVMGLTQSLAKELAPYGINVNAVCPGVVRTPLWDPLLDQLAEIKGLTREEAFNEFIAAIPLGRPQTPDDIGEVVAFLASSRAHNMTGQGINVTGGMQMH